MTILTDNKSFPTGEHTGISRNIVENSSFLIEGRDAFEEAITI